MNELPPAKKPILSVTQAAKLLNDALLASLPTVLVEGELSEVKQHNGNLYLTLKDEQTQLAGVIWRSVAASLQITPRVGQKVQCAGHFNYWGQGGRFQFVIRRMVEAGEGVLRQRFLELKSKLEREGLFDGSRKRALPRLPRAVGVITSADGAVVHDIDTRIRSRFPQIKRYLVNVKVQGAGAAEEIARAVHYLARSGLVDVLIVGRGGGSLEDLWAFNEEAVVRALFASPVPTVSAVGHETDVTLADLAADVRAPTPTAAAEIVVPDQQVLRNEVEGLRRRLGTAEELLSPLRQQASDAWNSIHVSVVHQMRERIAQCRSEGQRLQQIEPSQILERHSATIEAGSSRLRSHLRHEMQRQAALVQNEAHRLLMISPRQRSLLALTEIESAVRRLRQGLSVAVAAKERSAAGLCARLDASDYRRVLARGFAVVRSTGSVITSPTQVTDGAALQIELHRGTLDVQVTKLRLNEEEGAA